MKTKNFFDLLKLNKNLSEKKIESAYVNLEKSGLNNEEIRLAWKVLRDKHYRSVYEKNFSFEDVLKAGFFDDKEDNDGNFQNDNVKIPFTPFQKILDNSKVLKEGVVLFTTGCFSPIHSGHLDMMEIAKRELESKGKKVLGGYIVPANDSYVAVKNNNAVGLNSVYRVHLANLAVADSDWLMVDGSEAFVNSCDRNFTAIGRRLENYLNYHLKGIKLQLLFVCGEDLLDSSNAFSVYNGCVVVSRGKGRINTEGISGNIYFAKNYLDTEKYSSTSIRSGVYDMLPKNIVEEYKKIKSNLGFAKSEKKNESRIYHLRVEDLDFYKKTFENVSDKKLQNLINTFQEDIKKALEYAFKGESFLIENLDIKVLPLYLSEQKKILTCNSKIKKVISLDNCIKGDYNLGVSRLFELSGYQRSGMRLISRPGKESLENQISQIPAGDFTLLDDDIGSGQTLNLVKKIIPSTVNIRDVILLNRLSCAEELLPEYDIVDLRDFMFGVYGGGLVCSGGNGNNMRVPYVYPFVNLGTRAKIPLERVFEVSEKILLANLKFFKAINREYKLSDLPTDSLATFEYFGFSGSTKMVDVIEYFLSVVRNAINFQEIDVGIEFGHFYDNEGIGQDLDKQIIALKKVVSKIVAEKKSYNLSMFVDEYSSGSYKNSLTIENVILNRTLNNLMSVLENENVNLDFIAFESEMVKVAEILLKKIPQKNFYVINSKTKKTMVKVGDTEIQLFEEAGKERRYSCALLSAAWILFRLGEVKLNTFKYDFKGKGFFAKEIITILPKKYQTSENKAAMLLNLFDYTHLLKSVENLYI